MYIHIPVTEGKKIPTSMVNEVVISMITWLYTFRVDVPFTGVDTDVVMSSSLKVLDTIWPYREPVKSNECSKIFFTKPSSFQQVKNIPVP